MASLSWRALRNWKILTFLRDQCHDSFIPILSTSKDVAIGANVPFLSYTNGRATQWLFAIDFREKFDWKKSHIKVLLYAARKLSAILSDSVPPFVVPSIDCLKGLTAAAAKSVQAESGTLIINGFVGPDHPIARLGRPFDVIDAWQLRDTDGSSLAGRNGREHFDLAINNEDNKICRVTLPWGPFAAAKLTFKSAQGYRDTHFDIAPIIRLWSSLTGFPGVNEPLWR